jgi:hypothetical protein
MIEASKQKISACLKFLSMGKYRTPLYFRNQDCYSTVFSGVVTIFLVGLLFAFAIYEFTGIFNRDHYNFDIMGKSLFFSDIDDDGKTFKTAC